MVFCFGELLLRISPAANGIWIKNAQFPVYVGGAELNVATALARWGQATRYCTALPDNSMAADIIAYIESIGIDSSAIHHSGERIGTYYLPQGADLKTTSVIYDRAGSSFSLLRPGMLDWDELLDGCHWFHFSAISPALTEHVAALCLEGITAAVNKGLKISVDLNYRAKLWQYGRQPREVMPPLVEHCDLIMGNIWAADTMLGTGLNQELIEGRNREWFISHGAWTARNIGKLFPKCRSVANTFRFDNQDGLTYYTTLHHEGEEYVSPEFSTDSVEDRIGSGDCFMAGLIYGFSSAHPPQEIIDFSAAAAFGKLREKGDATRQTVDMVQKTLKQYGQR